MNVWILASGSAANALVIESAGETLLVDCGLGPRTLATRMRAVGIAPESVSGVAITHEAFDVMGLHISHDAAEPMALVVTCRESGARVAVATDIGEITQTTLDAFANVDALVLESNHCAHMLASGPYPAFLKQRVAAPTGHLSNADCGTALTALVHRGLSHIVLAHLSRVNNSPDVARDSASNALRRAGWRGQLAVAGPNGLASAFVVGASVAATRQLEFS